MNNKSSRKVSFDDLVACGSCDWLHYRTIIEKGSRASCSRCGHELYTRKPFSIDRVLAAALAGVVFLLLSLVLPFLSLSQAGITSSISVLDAVDALWASDMKWLCVMAVGMIILLPLVRLSLLIWVMFRLRFRLGVLPSMRVAMRWAEKLEPWAMAEIFMVGVVVSLVKIADLASLTVGLAFWSCRLCGASVRSRKRHSLQRTWAFLIVGLMAYIPANLYPILITTSFSGNTSDTIISGVIALAQSGSIFVAVVVFVASILIPVTKFVIIVGLALSLHFQWNMSQKTRQTLHRVTEFIGRWSMIDVFVVAVLAGIIQLGAILTIEPGVGINAFALSVVFTMFSATSLDPRLIWDNDNHGK